MPLLPQCPSPTSPPRVVLLQRVPPSLSFALSTGTRSWNLELEQGSKQSVGTSKRQTGRLKEERKCISGQGPENKVLGGGGFHYHPEPTVLSQRQQGSWFQVWGSLGLHGWRSFSPSASRRALLIRVFVQTTRGSPITRALCLCSQDRQQIGGTQRHLHFYSEVWQVLVTHKLRCAWGACLL